MNRNGFSLIRAPRPGSNDDSVRPVAKRLMMLWDCMRAIQDDTEPSNLGRQAVMMAMGMFDATLPLPNAATIDARPISKPVRLASEQADSLKP